MTDVLKTLLSVSVLVFSVASMLSAGLAQRLHHILAPLKSARSVFRVLLANFVLVPLLAYVIARGLALDRPLELGLMLIATAAGAPFLVKLAKVADADVALSASVLMLLLPVTVVYMPLVVPVLEPSARVNPLAIAAPLGLTLLLPLAAGFFIRARFPALARKLQPPLAQALTAALLCLIGTTLLAHHRRIVGLFGSGAIIAAILVIVGGFFIGYALATRPDRRAVLGLGTAQRNIAAAMVVATQSIGAPDTLALVVMVSIVDLMVLFPIAWLLRRRSQHAGAEAHA